MQTTMDPLTTTMEMAAQPTRLPVERPQLFPLDLQKIHQNKGEISFHFHSCQDQVGTWKQNVSSLCNGIELRTLHFLLTK